MRIGHVFVDGRNQRASLASIRLHDFQERVSNKLSEKRYNCFGVADG